MLGGPRVLFVLLLSCVIAIAVFASDSSVPNAPVAPPIATKRPVEDVIHGKRISDPYRWLEDAGSPDTQHWVNAELAYTRSLLDPLPGRDQLHKRLTELLSIGTVSAPELGGKYYFYTRREGTQNQPVLFVREGLDGKNRT